MSLSVVSTVADPSTLVAVAKSSRPIGKSAYWVPKGSDNGIWHPDDKRQGEWFKPKSPSVDRDHEWHVYDIANQEQARFELRRDLSNARDAALVLGTIAPEHFARFERDKARPFHWFLQRGILQRLKKNFVDTPTAWLTLDIDDLNLSTYWPGLDVVESDDEIADYLAEVFDRLNLDWLISDCVIQLSSSHGLMERSKLKAHIEWQLERPLTLSQQKSIAAHVNAAAEAGGLGRIADSIIYSPGHLIFTSPVQLLKRTFVNSKTEEETLADLPVQRVRRVNRGAPKIDVPPEALSLSSEQRAKLFTGFTIKPGHAASAAHGRKAATGSVKQPIAPGNVYVPIRSRIYATAMKTPQHLSDQVLAKLCEELSQELLALPEDEPGKLAKRLYTISPQVARRSWDDAIAKRRPWTAAMAEPRKARHGPREARAVLSRIISGCIDRALDARSGVTDPNPDALLTTAPPAVHTLIRVPPGVGKTHAALAAIKHPHLTMHRISYLAPTTRLSEEATARRAATLPVDDEYAQTLVRHHKGRTQLCEEPTYNRLAASMEKIGRSPLQSVCAYCPRKDVCKWPAQHADKGSGLVAGQHAHATSSMSALSLDSPGAPSFGFVDESMLSTLLSETQKPRKMKTLRRAVGKTEIRGKDGRLLQQATTDAIAYRSQALNAFKSNQRLLSIASVLWLNSDIRITRKDEVVVLRRVEDAIRSELDVGRTASAIHKEAIETIRDAITAKRSYRAAERRASNAVKAIAISRWFLSLYRAIDASLKIKDRQHVFGVRLTEPSSPKITITTRAELPDVIKNNHWVWLDGTANPLVWQACFGRANVETHEIAVDVEPGAYHLTQYPDRAYSRSMFAPDKSVDTMRGNSNIQIMRRFILDRAAAHPRVLVICQLPVKARLLTALGGNVVYKGRAVDVKATDWTVGNVRLEHFNALRGLDVYKDYPCAVIIGRPLPSIGAVEVLTEALHYDDPEVAKLTSAFKTSLTGGRHTIHSVAADVSVPCEVHPDERVEALRQQLVDAEVKQALMRLRLYDRTPDRPAELHVFGQADTGLVVHELRDWVDAQRTNAEIIAAGGIWCAAHQVATRLAGGLLDGYPSKNFERHMRKPPIVDSWPVYRVKLEHIAYAQRISVHPRYLDPANAVQIATDLKVLSIQPQERESTHDDAQTAD